MREPTAVMPWTSLPAGLRRFCARATLYGLPVALLLIATVGPHLFLRMAMRAWPVYIPLLAIMIIGMKELYEDARREAGRLYLRIGNRFMTNFHNLREEGREKLSRLRPGPSESIHVVDDPAAAEGQCPICREEAGDNDVECPECLARHHADCFEYNGGCGIYGCGGRR